MDDNLRKKRNEYANRWYANHRERILANLRGKKKTDEQKEKHKISARKYVAKSKEKRKLYEKQNADKLKILSKNWRENNKEEIRRKHKEYYNTNIESIREKDKLKYLKRKSIIQQHNKENREIINKKYREHISKRMEEDPLFKLGTGVGKLIRISIKRMGYSKKSKTYSILGCTFDQLKVYLENRFESWMDWENKGRYNGELLYGWDVDHIIPISSATTEEEIIKLNHYTNLQPLDSYINRHVKRNNIPTLIDF